MGEVPNALKKPLPYLHSCQSSTVHISMLFVIIYTIYSTFCKPVNTAFLFYAAKICLSEDVRQASTLTMFKSMLFSA